MSLSYLLQAYGYTLKTNGIFGSFGSRVKQLYIFHVSHIHDDLLIRKHPFSLSILVSGTGMQFTVAFAHMGGISDSQA
jgi:hypothetical protein